MSIVQSSAPSWVVSRRAVVIAACAGAVAVTADGLVSRTVGGGDAPTGTAAAAGLVATSFGSLRVLQLVRDRRPGLTTGDHALDAHGEAGNHTWAGRVALQLEVHNATPAPVLFSPGQVRLQVGDTGIGVTPEYASRLPGPLAAGGLEQLWVRYLTPSRHSVAAGRAQRPVRRPGAAARAAAGGQRRPSCPLRACRRPRPRGPPARDAREWVMSAGAGAGPPPGSVARLRSRTSSPQRLAGCCRSTSTRASCRWWTAPWSTTAASATGPPPDRSGAQPHPRPARVHRRRRCRSHPPAPDRRRRTAARPTARAAGRTRRTAASTSCGAGTGAASCRRRRWWRRPAAPSGCRCTTRWRRRTRSRCTASAAPGRTPRPA